MQLIEHERHLLHKFRRALPKEDQAAFDELIQDARFHAAEGAYVAHYDPLAVMLLSMLLEHHKRLREIQLGGGNPIGVSPFRQPPPSKVPRDGE